MTKKNISLKFDGPKTEVIFSTFLNFLNTLNVDLEIFVKNNQAFFSKTNCPSIICVYPFRDDLLYFEYSTDLSKDIDLSKSIPVQVSRPFDLELIKPVTKLILSLSTPVSQKNSHSQSSLKPVNNNSQKSINRFFKN